MSVDVSKDLELKNKILSGVEKLASAVSSTLGPSGKNILINEQDGSIRVTKDGVSVAKAFTQLKDPIENTAVQLVKTVAQKAVDIAGDGTSTSVLLAWSIIKEGFDAIDAHSNPTQVKIGIDKSVAAVLEELKKTSIDVVTEEQIMQVARLSSNGDEEVAKLITQAIDYTGEDGVVAIEESKTGESTLEKVEGMMFDRGYCSPYFSTNQNLMEAQLSNPYILIVDGRIINNDQILNTLEYVATKNRSLLVIAEDITSEALSTLIVNNARGTVRVCAVKAPDYGDRRTAILEDIAIMSGGAVVSEKKGVFLKKLKKTELLNYLGECRTVTVTSKDTTIVDGKPKIIPGEVVGVDEDGDNIYGAEINPVEERLKQLKDQIDNAKSAFDKQNLQDRLSKLTGGVAIINVGGISEVEMRERKDRVEDALSATKAGIAEGILPGGGMGLINAEYVLDDLKLENKDQEVGKEIIRKALYAPFITILKNAGIDNYYQILTKIKYLDDSSCDWPGYNVKTGEYGSLLEMGIIDPTKVTTTALEQSSSVAATILTTATAIFSIPEENKSSSASPDMQNYI